MVGRRRGILPRGILLRVALRLPNAPAGRAYRHTVALATARYLQERAARGDRARFERALAHVADVEPLLTAEGGEDAERSLLVRRRRGMLPRGILLKVALRLLNAPA
jgi:hypothetical protein